MAITMAATQGDVLSRITKLLIIVAFGTMLLMLVWYRIRLTPEMLRARIAEDLPIGSSSERVLAFLDSLGTEHSGAHPDARSHFDDGRGDFPTATRAITAALKGFRKGNLLSDEIFMQFKFDTSNRLLGHKVEYGYTFP
jgi:hypothetical protein